MKSPPKTGSKKPTSTKFVIDIDVRIGPTLERLLKALESRPHRKR